MSLRTQTIIAIAVTLSLMMIIISIFSKLQVQKGFDQLENREALQNVDRIRDAVSQQIDNLEVKIIDWSMWDDSYAYMQKGSKSFETSTLAIGSVIGMQMEVFAFRNNDGSIKWARFFDLTTKKDYPLPKELEEFFTKHDELFQYKNEEDKKSGILDLPKLGPSFVAIQPIVTSEGKGPITGSLIAVRDINENMVKKIGKLTHLELSMKELNEANKEQGFLEALSQLNSPEDSYIKIVSDYSISGFSKYMDLFGKPVLIARIVTPRAIQEQGQKTIYSFLLALLGSSLAFGIVMTLVLEKSVISRIVRLVEGTKDIQNSGDMNLRLAVSGNDEISTLSKATNEMLAAIQESQRIATKEQGKAAAASKLASLGEMAGGIAHEINNPMHIIMGKVEQLQDICEKVQFEEKPAVKMALESIKGMVMRISRIIKTMRYLSRKSEASPLVPTKLWEVVEDSLSLVSQQLRAHQIKVMNLVDQEIEINGRNQEIAQVILNLISNSRDALEAYDEKWIDISSESTKECVRLRVKDSGPEIPTEIAQKIMEPFFTTKEVGKGTGLGLSISQTIMSSHGGRLYYEPLKGHPCFVLEFPVKV